MAKKKKGNMRNIQSGDTVQFLNYLTPDHILRGKYNTGNNELDITDVPANLNSVITLGQGGGGGSSYTPLVEITVINNSTTDAHFRQNTFVRDNKYYVETPEVAAGETKVLTAVAPIDDLGNGTVIAEVNLIYSHTNVTASSLVNCTVDDIEYADVVDFSNNASLTLTVEDE